MLYGAMNFPVRPILKELEAISEQKFDYLELTMDPPQAHYRMIRQQKKRLLKALDFHNMGLLCHLPSFVSTADLTPSLREASLNEVLNSLDVAAELGCIKVVLHPSYIGGLSVFVMDKAREYALESLDTIMERSDKLGLLLCLENLFPRTHSLAEPEDFTEILEKFPNLKLTLDIGHAHIGIKRAEGLSILSKCSRIASAISMQAITSVKKTTIFLSGQEPSISPRLLRPSRRSDTTTP